MGSPAPTTPPWMSELVARNHKIVRNMWHSTESYFDGDEAAGTGSSVDGVQTNNKTTVSKSKTGGNHKKQVVEPKSASMDVTQPLQTKGGRTTMAAVVQEQMHRTKASKRRTEKSSPIREDGGFMDDGNPKTKQYMRNAEEQESILEYGPGIVRKLRSRYQSLALRQYSTRPSLQRSVSLENVLDMEMAASAEAGITSADKRESPSPAPLEQNYTNKKTSMDNNLDDKDNDGVTTTTMMTKSKSATAVLEQNQNHSQMYEKKLPGSRGRAAVSERRDRMRRARSVDALQPQRSKQEEEILEKFKAVVLPKEDIVIIEVSKPRANLHGLGELNNYLATGGDKTYPTQLFISPDRTTAAAGLTVSDSATHGGNRARSFISPEHELPPHDIVRETARIFEKNQENNKRVGQALRLSKSPSSQSENYSNPSSPTPQHQPKGPLMTTNANAMEQGVHPVNLSEDKTMINNINNAKPASLSHGYKQVGIIRPTINHPYTNSNTDKNVKIIESSPSNMLSPILSPSQTPYKTFLQQNSLSKPPLSPKPLFTSSPKPAQSLLIKSPVESVPPVDPNHQPPAPQALKADTVPKKTADRLPTSSDNRVKSPSFSANNKEIINGEAREKASVSSSSSDKGRGAGDRKSSSGLRQPLKHVPNSFTINSNIKEILPVSVPAPQKPKSSLNSPTLNGVTPKLPTASPTAPTDEQQSRNGKTAKTVVEPTKTSSSSSFNLVETKNNEPQKAHSPLPQRRTNAPPVAPPTAPRKLDEESNSNTSSQLRAHQKQKSNQGGNSPMVFNFTTRSTVPDYIEDDGLHNGRLTLRGTVSDESVDDIDSTSDLHNFDAKLIKIVGGNVIINGKSSIQKKPKSTKMNISFNEDGITTYEYPSESSLLADGNPTESTDMLGHKGPSVINNSGNGLGSYTPRLGNNNDYQLGNFDATSPKKPETVVKKDNATELIEDYLKPDSEDTTWSNELTSDIMF